MKKNKLVLSILSLSSLPILPMVAVSCNNSLDDGDGDGWIDPAPNPNTKLLNSSQIKLVVDAISFTKTKEAKKLSNDELIQIIKNIRLDYYPEDKQIENNIDKKIKFENAVKDGRFKKYFKYSAPDESVFPFLNGHILEMEIVSSYEGRRLPGIRFSILCPDKIYKGKMSSEKDGFVPLDD
ncbi:variable surface lipoprotein [Metamycoplasma phocicerebrale]|uniref:Variable surface lipoprotein n=1 Tax=Metamycoplasma phocicerebrale TaxID=142649 RepID=A0A3T0TUH8_9BACT|nr:variable surface lipoprotein [Metamycoplasma phocicerebrale]AZZ65757.1 variable surface lipoprotein [Metamycoplasma phocicerebrale]